MSEKNCPAAGSTGQGDGGDKIDFIGDSALPLCHDQRRFSYQTTSSSGVWIYILTRLPAPAVAAPPAVPSRPPGQPKQPSYRRDQRVYDASECIGAIVNHRCHGTILPNKAVHPKCHGPWIGGRCTGPLV